MRISLWWYLGLLFTVALVSIACAGGSGEEADQEEAEWELWASDQGLNNIHVLQPGDGDGSSLEVVDTVDTGAVEDSEADMPHMIDFDSEGRYAFVANPEAGTTSVIDAESRETVEVLDTGQGSHMAAVTPDDGAIWVAVIDDEQMVEVLPDYEAGSFEVGRVIDLAQDPLVQENDFSSAAAVCHQYTADSETAYITLGPGPEDGGLLVFDLEAGESIAAFNAETDPAAPANCGTILGPEGDKMYANFGGFEGEEGEWYAFDTESHELLHAESSRGGDAHGVWITPDGEELWMVNRATSDAIVIDPETDEITREVDFVGESPDVMVMDPEGRYMYSTLRGPEPRSSGPHAIEGETPGVAVFDMEDEEVLDVVNPDDEDPESDYHGINIRVPGGESGVSASGSGR